MDYAIFNFEKRYILIYGYILSFVNYLTVELDIFNKNEILKIISLDIISLIITLLILFIFSARTKEIIGGFFISNRPFQKSYSYIRKEKFFKKKYSNLINISNDKFYFNYYNKVKNIDKIIIKNAEYCIIRDFSFVVFISFIMTIIIYIVHNELQEVLIILIIIYILSIIAVRKKARDFVISIIYELYNKKR